MLDDVTKKRINTLRQILVGKLPDPKAQVEQITNALIYKFMNDMDEESVSMGGKATYFSGSFQKYSWKNLMNSQTSGVEKLSLYADALNKMSDNENLPTLFRDIFKDSVLPFKDPATLNMFLKEIDEFHYSNSEKLGDAFEYLLSFMGSQGDAGQFRTPRNIIDFITEIVNPQKSETVLDPACGTAGFLISSYKHILKQNTKKNLGDGLNASDRKKIGVNLNGYDISPDMVKMSLVNMYLHKFTNPKINEYDTLSNEERWNEYYDVILANPPFFSPKGGITPHNRFGVKSTKAEVLFIDYINEHLKPNGRAGIIVPEGIIFQTGTAYKQLRKKLVETSLIGVVSLPTGIFQPYSGVKTSVLILNKEVSKKSNHIFFVNIQNDGYSLNTNRNQINDNDLPQAILNIKDNKNLDKIEKKKLLDSEDISFVYSKYLEEEIKKDFKFDRIKISDIADIFSGSRQKGGSLDKGIPSIGGAQIGKNGNILNDKMVFVTEEHFNSMKKGQLKKGDVLIVKDGATTGKMGFYKGDFSKAAINEHIFALRTKGNFNNHLLYHLLKNENFQKKLKPFIQGIIGGINLKFSSIEIPYPPIEIQNQIVEEFNNYQKVIDGSKQIANFYKPSIEIDPSWKTYEIGEVLTLSYGKGLKAENRVNGVFNVYGSNGVVGSHNEYLVEGPFTIVGRKGSAGELHFSRENGFPIDTTFYISKKELKKDIDLELLFYLLKQINLKSFDNQSAVPGINRNNVYKMKISIPPISKQQEILKVIKEEVEIIQNNKNLINIFDMKINNKINKIWSN